MKISEKSFDGNIDRSLQQSSNIFPLLFFTTYETQQNSNQALCIQNKQWYE